MTAHYDSTSLSQGAYDNMSGSVGLLAIAEEYMTKSHRYGLRFVWCGSEERGLLGAKAYVTKYEKELKKVALNVNLDMIGCIMGKFLACCTSEEKLVHYISYMSQEVGFGVDAYQGVYSSDSTPFADKGIPAVSFARIAPGNTATIHNSYDTMAVMKMEHMEKDAGIVKADSCPYQGCTQWREELSKRNPNCQRRFKFSSVAQSCSTLCDPMNRSTPGLPVHYQLPESTQTHVH